MKCLEMEAGGDSVDQLVSYLDSVMCGDNVEVLSGFPSECIDLVVTSPPYDNLRTYGGHSWDFPRLASELTRVLKPGGVIVWVVADATVNGSETLTSMRQAIHFKDVCGLRVHDTMIYRKANFLPMTHRRYEQAWEYMLVLSKGKPKAWNPKMTETAYPRNRKLRMRNGDRRDKESIQKSSGQRIVENVFTYKCGGGHIDPTGLAHLHPAPFPESLAKDHVATWSNPGDVVLDPFAGSGTTPKAAKELGRRFVGIEINPEYVELCKKRLSENTLPLFVANISVSGPHPSDEQPQKQTANG
jgi:site-specific DNA-methyltransferase (adenine-specific)